MAQRLSPGRFSQHGRALRTAGVPGDSPEEGCATGSTLLREGERARRSGSVP